MAHTEKEILDYWMKKDSLGLNWTQEDRIIFAMREFANQSAQEQQTISKTEKVQTAVEWLENKFQKFLLYYEGNHKAEPYTILELSNDFEQAKQIEREQIEQAYNDAIEAEKKADYFTIIPSAEQYYNETYGK